ncbi:hypothetical protein HanIR_Chr10g0466541 [Helianthus annuus]|nr:hypothetical protein HanIR_Chr10g0466541 [Helianthus annuus]
MVVFELAVEPKLKTFHSKNLHKSRKLQNRKDSSDKAYYFY